jgi:hypothetical protein
MHEAFTVILTIFKEKKMKIAILLLLITGSVSAQESRIAGQWLTEGGMYVFETTPGEEVDTGRIIIFLESGYHVDHFLWFLDRDHNVISQHYREDFFDAEGNLEFSVEKNERFRTKVRFINHPSGEFLQLGEDFLQRLVDETP